MGYGIPIEMSSKHIVGSMFSLTNDAETGEERWAIPLGLNIEESIGFHWRLENEQDDLPDDIAGDVFRAIIITRHKKYRGNEYTFESDGVITDVSIASFPNREQTWAHNRIILDVTDPLQNTFLKSCYPHIFDVQWKEPVDGHDFILMLDDLLRLGSNRINGLRRNTNA